MRLNRRQFVWPILPLLLALICSRQAAANDRLIDSLEWAAVDAQMIVRAKVIARHPISDKNDPIVWNKFDLEILETIKGPASSRLNVVEWSHPFGRGNGGLLSLADATGEVLLFLDRNDRFGTGDKMPPDCKWVVRKQGGWYVTHNTSAAFQKNRGSMISLTIKFVGGEELLSKVRELAAWSEKSGAIQPRRTDLYNPPWKLTTENGITIPMADRFVQQMRDFAAHDNERSHVYPGFTTLPPCFEWYFDGRQQMYRLTRSLNIAESRPIYLGPADIHEPALRTLIGAALILLACPIGWIFARRKNGSRFRLRSMLAIWFFAIAAALTAAWLLSSRQAISIVWQKDGGARWQLASYAGVLRLARVVDPPKNDSPRPVGIVGGIFYPDPKSAPDWNLRNVTLSTSWEKWGASIGTGTPALPSKPNARAANIPLRPPPPQAAIWVAIVPWLWPVCTFSPFGVLLVLIQLKKSHTHRRRRRQGRCPICGYDLRATPTRCPECGATPQHTKNGTGGPPMNL